MSTYVLMKILESNPSRYDCGIRLLTLGSVDRAYDRLLSPLRPDDTILDIGCGTGALTLRAARRGAHVRGMDINTGMLEIAGRRVDESGLSDRVELVNRGIAELDAERSESYDAVMSGLCFSELSDDELRFTLREARRILKPGGYLLIADEVRPDSPPLRLIYMLLRLPLLLLAYLLTQTTTRTIQNLPEKISSAGFRVVTYHKNFFGSFGELVGQNPDGAL